VRFRLGAGVEADRTLDLDKPGISECALERPGDEQNRRTVRARLRLLDEQQPVEQLDRVVLVEEAVVDQPRVLAAGPAMQGGPRGRHVADAIDPRRAASTYPGGHVPRWIPRRRRRYNGGSPAGREPAPPHYI